ncbi:zinc ribbon domain-containing protein [Massilistercora timonensis]|uniref:zinc ribbon domain-containing protein n=1 Tax=Massilistercora timonensis TaxID=2086584 RepID=UPI00320B40DB
MYCGRCGKELKDTARFCPNCGTPVPDAINRKVEYAYVQKKTGNRKMLWFWIVVIGFLVVFSVIGIKIYLGEKPENRLEGTWYGVYQDYDTGEYIVNRTDRYRFAEDGRFWRGDEFVGQCEIEDGVIELYWDDWTPWGTAWFLEDSDLTVYEKQSIKDGLSEYDEILLYESGNERDIYVKIE